MAERSELHSVERARLDHAIMYGAPYMRPIWLAVRDAGCAFAIVTQGPDGFDLPLDKPTIALIGDDLQVSKGPNGFHRKSLRRLLAQCKSVSIVACEPMLMAYATPVATTVALGKPCAIIETRARHEADWKSFVEACAPDAALVIATTKPEGSVH